MEAVVLVVRSRGKEAAAQDVLIAGEILLLTCFLTLFVVMRVFFWTDPTFALLFTAMSVHFESMKFICVCFFVTILDESR